MLPVTQTSLVNLMRESRRSRGMTPQLARFLHDEYGVNEPYALSALGRAPRVRSIRIRYGPGEWVRRLLATVSDAFAGTRASPGGA